MEDTTSNTFIRNDPEARIFFRDAYPTGGQVANQEVIFCPYSCWSGATGFSDNSTRIVVLGYSIWILHSYFLTNAPGTGRTLFRIRKREKLGINGFLSWPQQFLDWQNSSGSSAHQINYITIYSTDICSAHLWFRLRYNSLRYWYTQTLRFRASPHKYFWLWNTISTELTILGSVTFGMVITRCAHLSVWVDICSPLPRNMRYLFEFHGTPAEQGWTVCKYNSAASCALLRQPM